MQSVFVVHAARRPDGAAGGGAGDAATSAATRARCCARWARAVAAGAQHGGASSPRSGLLAGLLAASGAAVGGWLLARQLELHYHFDGWLWLAGVVGAALLVCASGWLAVRPVLSQAPRALLN